MVDENRTGAEVVEEALRLLLAKDMAAFAGLWAERGVIEYPFAAPGYPSRVEGRTAITEYLAGYTDLLDIREVTSKTVHQSVEPGTAVVEFEVAGVVVATGRLYRMTYIAVVVTSRGEIVSYRDYWSPMAAAEVLGSTEDVNAAFTPATKA